MTRTLITTSFIVDIDENHLAEVVTKMDEAIAAAVHLSLAGLIETHGVEAVADALDEMQFYGTIAAPRRRSPEVPR